MKHVIAQITFKVSVSQQRWDEWDDKQLEGAVSAVTRVFDMLDNILTDHLGNRYTIEVS